MNDEPAYLECCGNYGTHKPGCLATRVETLQAHAEKLKGIIAKRQARVETLEAALRKIDRAAGELDIREDDFEALTDITRAALSPGDGERAEAPLQEGPYAPGPNDGIVSGCRFTWHEENQTIIVEPKHPDGHMFVTHNDFHASGAQMGFRPGANLVTEAGSDD